ncbi:hypothetical protein [uncultured Ruegeria sp.]|uniref:hypothetical protein n=1 Tax=uncultured Ruegeria sp. TaxID=259304 RepID=UPI00261F3E5D|nr:hypothetical protein [uncultured Ruegeria sp.]
MSGPYPHNLAKAKGNFPAAATRPLFDVALKTMSIPALWMIETPVNPQMRTLCKLAMAADPIETEPILA